LCQQHEWEQESRFLLADGKDPVSNVAAIFIVSSKVSIIMMRAKSHGHWYQLPWWRLQIKNIFNLVPVF
jgi:hypothetical protein